MLQEFKDQKPVIHHTVYVADSAEIIGDVKIGENSSVWNGAVLRGDMHYIKVGKNVSIQDNAVLHGTLFEYPTIIGDNVSIGHSAIVHGCTIGNNCLIGMGSVILEGAVIGDWCIIGAGAVITEGCEISDGSLVLGVPARAVKKITKDHKDRITKNWESYVVLKDMYLQSRKK